jgi:hypothetical protein
MKAVPDISVRLKMIRPDSVKRNTLPEGADVFLLALLMAGTPAKPRASNRGNKNETSWTASD